MSSFTPQQIEDFLQEFFDVVGARQYVGARYVPIFGRAGEDTVEWDDGAPYEPLTVVMHGGVSYVSRRYVPSGIQVTDTDYWVETYRFNAQVEQYRQEVLSFQGQIDDIRNDYTPFPDPDHYPKYGTSGQVLTTLADGTTKWEDPVVPSDAQAEAVITEWLDEHPEATTTVEDGAVTRAKLNDAYMNTRNNILTTGSDLNDFKVPDMLYAATGTANLPTNSNYLVLVLYLPWQSGNRQTVLQVAYQQGHPHVQYMRTYDSGSDAWTSWETWNVSDIPTNAITHDKLSRAYMNSTNNLISSPADLNDHSLTDVFGAAGQAQHLPTSGTNDFYIVENHYFPWNNGGRYSTLQLATLITPNIGTYSLFSRRYNSSDNTWDDWQLMCSAPKIHPKKIVFMGDSTYEITGIAGRRIPDMLARRTGATCINAAFGGSRVSGTSGGDYLYFDFPALCDAIVAGDFTDQQSHIPSAVADRFTAQLAALSAVDFSTVDVLCIEYGTNDFTGNVPLGQADETTTTVMGAMSYGIKKLLAAYPNLNIFIDGVRYRFWLSGDSFSDDITTHTNTLDLRLYDYADAIEEVAGNFNLPYSDNIHHYGWNRYNRATYFPANDGTHFNVNATAYAEKILFDRLCGLGVM